MPHSPARGKRTRYPGLVLIKRSPAFSKDFFTTRRPVRFDISSVSLHSDLFVLAARGLRRSCQPSAPINLRSSIMSDTIESTVMAEPEASSSSAILTGMKRGFPIFLGYVPLGFAYGVLAVQNNIPAVLEVMKFIYDHIIYAELNTKSDYCQVCGWDGEISVVEEDGKLIWKCPKCGNTDQDKMNVARRTCGYIGTQFWNQGRTAEIKDRVLHL